MLLFWFDPASQKSAIRGAAIHIRGNEPLLNRDLERRKPDTER